jgi:uncharacterized protein (TIGR02594 family)
MSAPGTPPETGYLEDEGSLPPNATPTTDLPPDSGGFRGVPDLLSGVERQDDRYPTDIPSFRLSQTDPQLSPEGPPQEQLPKPSGPRSALFNPTPIEQMQPRMQRRDQEGAVDKSILYDPQSIAQLPTTKKRLTGGIPDEPQRDGTNGALGKAVDKALGMEGMHERVNQGDIKRYLATGGAGMNPAKTAWCAAFVNATLKMAGIEGSGSNVATSFLTKGERVVTEPQRGDVVVEPRGREPGQVGGHVGMATGRTRQNPRGGYEFEVVSGNLSNRVGREWVPAQSTHVRRLGPSGGLTGAQLNIPKVETETVKAGTAAPLTLEQQSSKGFVPYTAAPAVHPTTGKPIIPNADGTISTEKTITITDESGKYVNIPTIVGGKQLPNKAAVKLYQAGKNPAVEGPFPTLDEAVAAAKTRSAKLAVPEPAVAPVPTTTEAAVATPTLTAPAPVTGGPVYAPAGTPAEELTRLSQTKPWGSKQGGFRSWKKNQLEGPLKSIDPHNIGLEAPELPQELNPTQSEEDPLNLLEPTFEQPLYVKRKTPFDILTEPMPISPETREGPVEPILRGPMSQRLDDVEEPVPLSTPQQFTLGPSDEPVPHNLLETEPMPVPYNPSDNQKALAWADQVSRPIRQTGQAFMGMFNKLPYAIGGAATGLLAAPGALMFPKETEENPSPMLLAHRWFQGRHDAADKFNKAAMGLDPNDKPRTPIEKSAELLGESISPIGPSKVAVTAAVYGVKSFFDDRSPIQFLSPVFAKTPKKKDKDTGSPDKFIPAVEGHTAEGNMAIGQLFQEINGTVVPMPDGSFKLIPNASMYGNVNLPPELAIKQYQRTGLNFGTFSSEKAAQDFLAIQNSKVVRRANGATGPEEFKAADLTAMGLTLAGTVGIAFAPSLVKKFTSGNITRTVQGRTIEDAPTGTLAYSRLRDLGTAYHDINKVPGSVARSAGVPEPAIKEINETWAMQTRGGATNLASAVINNGVAITPSFTFRVRTPLQQAERVVDQPFIEYMAARSSLEEIAVMERKAQNAAGNTPIAPNSVTLRQEPQTGRGLTRTDYEQTVQRYEQAHPEVVAKAAIIRENKAEMLRFQSDGEYATVTPAEAQRIRVEEPNVVPYGFANRTQVSPVVTTATDMHKQIRARLENEAKGSTVDIVNQYNPNVFQQITAKQYRENKNWQPNTVTFKRRGETEYWVTDPLLATTMKVDPFYSKGLTHHIVNMPRRGFEAATTGMFAPAFAWVNFLRSQKIVKTAARTMGWEAPTIGRSLAEIPRDIYAQGQKALASSFDRRTNGSLARLPDMAQHMIQQIDRASGGQISQMFGPQAATWMQGLGRRLEVQYQQSNHARLQQAGAQYGGMFDQQLRNDYALGQAIVHAKGPLRTFLEGWKAVHGSIHSAPTAAAARMNIGPKQRRDQWALETRRLTGDPQAGGEFAVGGRVIPFHQTARTYNNPVAHAVDKAADFAALKGVQAIGLTSELGRAFVPWFNVSMQGMKRIARAYNDNPKIFAASMFTSQMMPAATAYYWNRYLDTDPNGVKYSDYMMNGRSPYNTMLNFYIGIPGRPAAEGIELPGKFHETVIFPRMMELAMDHAFRSSRYTMKEDFKDAAWNALKIPFSPAVHPFMNAWLGGAHGLVGPQGLFEGDIYKRKNYAFDQNVGLPVNLELFARAFGGAAADVIGGGIAAAVQAEGGQRIGSFFAEAGRRQVERTPVLRNILGMTPKQSGNTRVTQEMYERQKAFKMLDEYYRNWGTTGGNIKLSNKPVSGYGGQVATEKLGRPTPLQQPGLKQPEPTNPMYKQVMAEVHDRLTKDDIEKGGIGYKSLLQRYSKTTKELKQMQHISEGNHSKWQEHLNSNPEVVEFLEQNRVDSTSRRAVQSFYEQIRQNAAREILHTLKQVEKDVGDKLGKKDFKIEDLDPYAKPKSLPEWLHVQDVLDHLNGMWYSATQEVPKGGY